jgi:hypothetical protein
MWFPPNSLTPTGEPDVAVDEADGSGQGTDVARLTDFREGMRVRVDTDEARVRRLADGHGGWNDGMIPYLGQEATVVTMDPSDETVRIRCALKIHTHTP